MIALLKSLSILCEFLVSRYDFKIVFLPTELIKISAMHEVCTLNLSDFIHGTYLVEVMESKKLAKTIG